MHERIKERGKISIRRGHGEGPGEIGHVNILQYSLRTVRTTAKSRKHAEEEHNDQDPKIQRQKNLRMIMFRFASSLYLRAM